MAFKGFYHGFMMMTSYVKRQEIVHWALQQVPNLKVTRKLTKKSFAIYCDVQN